MRLRRSAYSSLLLGVVAFASPGYASAQSLPGGSFNNEMEDLVQKQTKSVSIVAKNRSIESILNEIVEKTNVRLFFSTENPELQKKTSLTLEKVSPIDAVNAVIRGTNLIAGKTADGQGIMIRSKSDTTKSSQDTGKSAIVGIVSDSSNSQPIVGATVTIVGLKRTVVTNDKGVFRFENIPSGRHQVSVRMLGFVSKSQTVAIGDEKVVTPQFILSSSATSLSEVVTTATGQQRRVEIAHDIAKINPEAIMERTPVRSVADILEAAQVPGVLVQRSGGDPGSPTRIRIRGIGSISQSNDPVVILDGVWIDAASSSPSRLDDIDPASIESIEIIRGPSAATLFGQDASNGVIVITSKKGQAGPTRWNLSYNRDWGQTYGKQPLFYAGMGYNANSADLQWCPIEGVLKFECTQDTVLVLDPNNKLLSREGTETNNRYMLQMDGGASNVTYAVTLSTGNTIGVRRLADIEKIRYRLLGYNTSSEFSRPSSLRRNNITTSIVFTPRSNLSIGMTLTGTQTNLKDNSYDNLWSGLGNIGLTGRQFDTDTAFAAYGGGQITANEKPIKTTTGIVSSNIQYRPGGFVISGNFGAEKSAKNESNFGRLTLCDFRSSCRDTLGTRREASENKSLYTVRLNASTSLNLGSFNKYLDIRPSIGGDYKKTDQHLIDLHKRDIPVGDRSITMGTLSSSRNNLIENATAGWYLNSTIGLFRRVYFDVGIRQDIGSAITSSKDAVYPKIGGSWLVSDESFWKENPYINSLRLRSAIGHSAVQPDLNDIHGQYVNWVEYVDGKFINTVELGSTGNNRLQPERAVELEIGFDLDMLNDRLNLIGTYAHKDNRNTLVVRNLPPSFGIWYNATRKENVAKVRNRNFELSANVRAIETRRALLILNYALTLSDNKVATLGEGITPFNSASSRIAAGYPLAGVWERQVLGYRDANKDGLLSREEVILSDSVVYRGWSQPRYRASYGASFTLNNQFVFDSRFAYQSRYVQSYQPYLRYGAEDVNAPLPDQAQSIINGLSGRAPISDLRWNSASVTYHLPKSVLNRIGGRSLSVSLQASNLAIWSNYVGRDPGVNSALLSGEFTADNGLTPPRPRLYVIDFKFGL